MKKKSPKQKKQNVESRGCCCCHFREPKMLLGVGLTLVVIGLALDWGYSVSQVMILVGSIFLMKGAFILLLSEKKL